MATKLAVLRAQLGTPTFKQYSTNAQQWAEWRRQVVQLDLSDIRRHAAVSTDNRHQCHDCFCCAAAEVLTEVLS